MTRLFDLPLGKGQELLLALQNAGLTAEHALLIIDQSDLARKVVTSLDGEPMFTPPPWWRDYDAQIRRAKSKFGNIWLPEPPANFVPTSKTGVPLLHVPDMFDRLWDKVDAPEGYTKYRWSDLKADKRNLRLAPNKVEYTQPVWLEFDPEYGVNVRPDSLWGQPNLAASEVFSGLIQFPEWPLAWFNGASAPNLSGYRFKYNGNWSDVPYLYRWDDVRRLKLLAAGRATGLRTGRRLRSGSAEVGNLVPWYPGGSCDLGLLSLKT